MDESLRYLQKTFHPLERITNTSFSRSFKGYKGNDQFYIKIYCDLFKYEKEVDYQLIICREAILACNLNVNNSECSTFNSFSRIKVIGNDLIIIWAYFEGVDLCAVLRELSLELIHRKYIMFQLLLGLRVLHGNGIVHLGIRPTKIMLNSECEIKFRIGNWKSEGETYVSGYIWGNHHRSPEELFETRTYTAKMDMFCVGLLLAELILKKPLLISNSNMEMIRSMVDLLGIPSDEDIRLISVEPELTKSCIDIAAEHLQKKRQLSNLFSYLEDEELDFLENLLQINPNNRMSAGQALLHPYLDEFRDWLIPNKLHETMFLDLSLFKSKKNIITILKREMNHFVKIRNLKIKLAKFSHMIQQARLKSVLCDLIIILTD